ncbi:MAG: NAD(P)H-dependent oxidoreductase subunit E, partial [Candidatus Bathyarchaeota archaeon]|nr:NAD(P)H-dependent oxidoreductase subunit E [Candidatus Bathyarchaeota archaeon]
MRPSDIIKLAQREQEIRRSYEHRINVCGSSGCVPFGALGVLKAFEDVVKQSGLGKECKVARSGCVGTCSVGPAVLVEPGDYIYQKVTPEKARQIVEEHIVAGVPSRNLLYSNEGFFKKQLRIILKNAGRIDPYRAMDYISQGGYSALIKCITEMSPKDVIEEISASGLRGRGGLVS